MKPGETVSPRASITRAAAALPSRPMSTMRPPRMPRSAASHGLPLPSRTRPLRMSTSYGGACGGQRNRADEQRGGRCSHANSHARHPMSRPAPSQTAAVLLKPDRRCAKLPTAWRAVQRAEVCNRKRDRPATLARAPEERGARAARFGPSRRAPVRQRRADTRASAASGATIDFGTWIQTAGRFRIRPSASGFNRW